jgi:dTDP-4-amino-4,6-dideoxygalactose transaminase
VLCVHQLGLPCDVGAIVRIARGHGLAVVEDAACALGSELLNGDAWEKLGRPHADVACFSFHPRKTLTTGDGGMLTTGRSEWDEQFRLLRHQGMSVSDVARHGASSVIFESYPSLGYNYRLSDIQAAVGRAQLRRLPALVARRRELSARYQERLADVCGLGLPIEPAGTRANWQSYCVRLPDGVDQRAFMQRLLDEGIATRRGVMCAHREPAYPRGTWSCGSGVGSCACEGEGCSRLAVSERAQDRCVLLPLFAQMTEAEQDRVVAAVRKSVAP